MFEPLDSGVMRFDPEGCRVNGKDGTLPGLVHTRMALALLRELLATCDPSLWVIQVYAQRDRTPFAADPLAQRDAEVPVLAVYLARYKRHDDQTMFLMQHMNQYAEYDSPAVVISTLETFIARWMVEGLST